MKKIVSLIVSIISVLAIGNVFLSHNVYAADPCAGLSSAKTIECQQCIIEMGDGAWSGNTCDRGDNQTIENLIPQILQVAFFILGILAIVMIIYGGIRYTTSRGDSKGVEAAKNTIMWSVIGLVVAICAYAIVSWVMTSLDGSSGNPSPSTYTDQISCEGAGYTWDTTTDPVNPKCI